MQDYCNVFAPLTLISGGFGPEFAMSLLKKMKELGVPGIAEYFCAKAISGGVSMDAQGFAEWSALPDSVKAKFA